MFNLKHLIGLSFTVPLIVVALLLSMKFATTTARKTNILKCSAIILLALELFKYLFAVKRDGFLASNYLPLHICSMFLWANPIAAFCNGKKSDFARHFSVNMGIPAGLSVLLFPKAIIGSNSWFPLVDNILVIHSFLYHGVMIFFGLYLLFSKLYQPSLLGIKNTGIILFCLAIFNTLANFICGTDFMSLSMSPKNWLLPVIEQITFIPFFIGYMTIVISSIFVPYLVYNWITKSLEHKKLKRGL